MNNLVLQPVAKRLVRALPWVGLLASTVLISTGVLAADSAPPPGSFGEMAQNLVKSFPALVDLIVAVCYIAGIAFAAMAIFKFKQHKDNPSQHPLGTPVAMLFIAR